VARNKRRLSNKELRNLQKIEKLLDNHSKEVKENNQPTVQRKVEMKARDPFATIKLSSHAYKRANERFNMDENRAPGYFRDVLRKAKRIGLHKDKYGNDSVVYAYGRIAVYVEPDLSEIKTVLKQHSIVYEPIKSTVAELHAKELRKIERTERARIRKLEQEELKANVEIASAKLRMHKTRSESVRMACQAHINGIEQYIEQLKSEITEIQASKRQLCKSMVAVV